MSKEKLLFVKHSITCGDADDSCDGFAVVTKKDWDQQLELTRKYLDENDTDTLEVEYHDFQEYLEMKEDGSIKEYTVAECTREEAETIKKFFGKHYSGRIVTGDGFRWLTDWLPYEWLQENGFDQYS